MEAVYGPEHPEVASTLTNLGNVQQQLGELEAARVTLQRALAISEASYGSEHPQVAITLGSLGNVQRELGEFEAARVTLQRALAISDNADMGRCLSSRQGWSWRVAGGRECGSGCGWRPGGEGRHFSRLSYEWVLEGTSPRASMRSRIAVFLTVCVNASTTNASRAWSRRS